MKKNNRKKIIDEFTGLEVSRQRKYQLRQRDKGNCIKCSRPATTKHHCKRHAKRASEMCLRGQGVMVRKYNTKYGRRGEMII